MLFTRDAWQGIADGSITVTFRTWSSRRVVPGRTYHVVPGVIRVDSVERIRVGEITEEDATAAGEDRDTLRHRLASGNDEEVWRVRFQFVGPDPRIELRDRIPDEQELEAIARRLGTIDDRSREGPWTRSVLSAIASRPADPAPELAEELGLQTQVFKRRVRRLKELGLTESMRVGYRLSPRGSAVAARLEDGT